MQLSPARRPRALRKHAELRRGVVSRRRDAPPARAARRLPANLRAFADEGSRWRAKVVLLTRPTRLAGAELAALAPSWRSRVAHYNLVVLALGREPGVRVLDAAAHFPPASPGVFADECHFTDAGHRLMAEWLAEQLPRLR
jgi:lysophospholipase L1-like esterase